MIRVELLRDLPADVAEGHGLPETKAGVVLVLDMDEAWPLVTGGFGHFADVRPAASNVVPFRRAAA